MLLAFAVEKSARNGTLAGRKGQPTVLLVFAVEKSARNGTLAGTKGSGLLQDRRLEWGSAYRRR